MTADPLARAAEVLGDAARRDVPLGPLTTYRVGGPAALLVDVHTDEDLARLVAAVGASGAPVLVVGRGSNLLVADAGFPGIAVVLGEAYAEVVLDGTTVRAGGAAALPVLARRTAAAGLRGLEWAVGVPGSVGGAVRMNAGGHGSDVAASLVEVRVVDLASGHDGVVAAADLDLGYRRSALAPSTVVVEATFATTPGDAEAAGAEVAEIVRWRREHQPGGQNAGSVFTNPPGDAAGRLVEAAGCRGLRLGTAQVSPKHANFIQADPGGSSDDVAALIREVRRRVAAATGVVLHPELRMMGFPPQGPPEVEG
jgi:UDP-N-acetylmuramate dehydrogenase